MVRKIIPKVQFVDWWKEHNEVLAKDELILILYENGTVSMRKGDGQAKALKCRMVSPWAYMEIDDETGTICERKGHEYYKWLRAYVHNDFKEPENFVFAPPKPVKAKGKKAGELRRKAKAKERADAEITRLLAEEATEKKDSK